MNVWLFIILMVVFLFVLLSVDWNSNYEPRLDEMWMLEDDAEEAEDES